MNTESEFTKGQEVWVKARLMSDTIDRAGDIKLHIRCAVGNNVAYAGIAEISTTEQILMEEAIKNDLKSDKFRVYIDDVRKGLNYYYLYAPDGTEHVYPKECFSPSEVIDICDEENAKIASQKAEQNAKQNAELPEQNAECWVRAKIYKIENDFAILDVPGNERIEMIITPKQNIRFTEPTHSTAVIELIEPDRTRKFRKGDKVRLVERDGRTPIILDTTSYKINNIYEVARDEEDLSECWDGIDLKNPDTNRLDERFLFCHLDLVEPAPEPKYWLHESPKTYSIYYKGQFGRVITAMLMQKELYTLEEAQEQCDKLNEKD